MAAFPAPSYAQDEDASVDDQEAVGNPRSAKVIYPIDPFTLSIFKRGKVEGLLLLVIKLELERTVSINQIDRKLPVLRNELNLAARRLGNERAQLERPLNPGVAAWYMQRAADKALGSGVVRVLVDEAIYRGQ